jgi:LCP family protein required for cell wall assembly
MAEKKASRITRFWGFIIFRIIPVILIVGIVWFSYGVAKAVAQRVGEQVEAGQRSPLYEGTAIAIASTLTTNTPPPTATSIPSDTPTLTNTATSTATLTPTPVPSDTATPAPTLTFTLVPSDTPIPTATSTDTPIVVAQAFATNTPRALAVTLPAFNTAVPSIAPVIEASPTPTFTETPTSPPPTFTFTPPPVEAATARPLPTLFLPSAPDANAVAPTAIPTQVPTVDRHGYDLVNILLMGGDGELTGDNVTRTDTMIIVSINRTTNTVAMLSLPRDLYVYIPGWTMQRLNLAYTHGEQVGWQPDGGWGLMRQTIFYNLGVNVHYYALINLSGFKQIVDTLGGVDLTVDCAIQDYPLIDAPAPPQAIRDETNMYTLPVGAYHMDGGSALWYARSRHNSSDFDRGRRQQQLLRAIWRTARAGGQVSKLPEVWSQLSQVVQTNLGFDDMVGLLPFALNLDPGRIDHFTMARLYHTTPWQPPDGSNVQLPNYDPIKELLDDFYQPPTESQITEEAERILVYNGSSNVDLDKVAADRLGWDGYNAIASGAADNANYADSILIDYTGQTKGSHIQDIAKTLNINPENIRSEPDPTRQADFEVILGSNYNSCTEAGVLPPVDNSAGG